MDLRQAIQLYQQGRLPEAEAACRRILGQNPADAAAAHVLGRIALESGRRPDAVAWLSRAVALLPDALAYRVDLGAALAMSGRAAEALPHVREAVRRKPDAADLRNNLGGLLEALGRLDDAVAEYDEAIRLRPAYAEAHYNRGNALRRADRFVESAAAYRESLRLRPDYHKAENNLAIALEELCDADGAIECLRKVVERRPHDPAAHSSLLYALHYSPAYDAEALYREHVTCSAGFQPAASTKQQAGSLRYKKNKTIRVGYVSPDLRDHTVTRFIGGALAHHDREAFEVFLYSDAVRPDATSERMKGLGHAWRDCATLSDGQLAETIRADSIDVLVDLRGHGAGNRLPLFARKPAPVQVTMVGYFDTTGLPQMDWRVTDAWMDPPGVSERFHTEKLFRLPGGCWCYSPDEDAPEVAPPPVFQAGHVTFGSLNKIAKVSHACAKVWAQVLEAVPGSRLLLSVAGDGPTRRAVRARLGEMGLPPERLDFADKTPTRRGYLETFNRIDIALDPFPFNGITTTCDGLWMGVPAVSLAGTTSVSRTGRSILHVAGLPELAADTPGQFVATAAGLARDVDRLRELRMGMRELLVASPLLDAGRFTRELEAAYRRMRAEGCEGARGPGVAGA